jgi:hypothetical protein
MRVDACALVQPHRRPQTWQMDSRIPSAIDAA